jgi:hypothetical protein
MEFFSYLPIYLFLGLNILAIFLCLARLVDIYTSYYSEKNR